jgi:hypothetical protein
MLPFIGGFMTGGIVGFFLCALLHVSHSAEHNFPDHAKPSDRRGPQKATFPLIDCNGVLVHVDRRVQPDRRSHGISHNLMH